jgi:hypothetical protein
VFSRQPLLSDLLTLVRCALEYILGLAALTVAGLFACMIMAIRNRRRYGTMADYDFSEVETFLRK